MKFGNFAKRGALCIIIALLYLAASLFYYYYLTKNEPVNKENYDEQKIYGPNIFLIIQLATLFMSMILYLFMAYIRFTNWRTSATRDKKLAESCDNYQGLVGYAIDKVNPLSKN
ncbi:hypothetical protein Hokovirus_2_242 [Hokovirus HKV1]|uniref:Uncharacterized protein n=1 Tax=Hokovirus HKV1 TaxID=1977638 RepID=A0A1V0SG66_9VIRU|nr:hypothetical protein Hokovirus_2_242 [Hokovirus HKV1]